MPRSKKKEMANTWATVGTAQNHSQDTKQQELLKQM